jgi:hypothetical protein
MAVLTAQQVVTTGLEATFAAAAGGGDKFANTGRQIVEIVNGDASDTTLTIVTPGKYKGHAIADDTVTITAGERRHVGPFDPEIYNNASGQVDLAYSSVTSLTLAILQI